MAYNLFVSYDLDQPGQNYPRVEAAIKQLGVAVKVHMSLYYVKSQYTSEQACQHVQKAIDRNDRLIVIDANNAHWMNPLTGSAQVMQSNWPK